MPMLLLLASLMAVAPDPLAAANADFRALYRDARSRALASAGPVLLVEGGTLVFRDGAVREAFEFLPAGYTSLKQTSHVPLALFVALHDAHGPLEAATRTALAALVAEVKRARVALGEQPSPQGSPARQQRVLDASLALAEGVLQRGAAEPGELDRFARRMGPLLEANADDAAALELEALQRQVQALRPRLGARYHVVVVGSHMARTHEIALQFFEQLLGEKDDGGRVIFAEGLWEEEKALELLGTHLLDRAASAAFFGDPARLHEDMLAEGARKHLRAHPPK